VGRPGPEPADGSDLWFKAHPKEEPMNHSLAVVRHRARRALTTQNQPQQQEANGLTGDPNRLGVWCLVVENWHLLSSSAPGVHHGEA